MNFIDKLKEIIRMKNLKFPTEKELEQLIEECDNNIVKLLSCGEIDIKTVPSDLLEIFMRRCINNEEYETCANIRDEVERRKKE